MRSRNQAAPGRTRPQSGRTRPQSGRTKPSRVEDPALHAQFGGGVQQVKHWKPRFLRNLAAAMAAYPAAKAEVTKQGVRLHPSPAPTGPARLRSVAG